jgi:hypothetical protein
MWTPWHGGRALERASENTALRLGRAATIERRFIEPDEPRVDVDAQVPARFEIREQSAGPKPTPAPQREKPQGSLSAKPAMRAVAAISPPRDPARHAARPAPPCPPEGARARILTKRPCVRPRPGVAGIRGPGVERHRNRKAKRDGERLNA